MICLPTRICGVSEVRGSWKIMVTALPRNLFNWPVGALRISVPRYFTLPLALPLPASNPKAARNSWLLPEPLSPTTPRHSLSWMVRLASFTA